MRGAKLIYLSEYFINGISFHIEASRVYYLGNAAFCLVLYSRVHVYVTFYPLISTTLINYSFVFLNADHRIKEQDISIDLFEELNSILVV